MYICEWCNMGCRIAYAFCSIDCANKYDDEGLSRFYNHRSNVFINHFYDSVQWFNGSRAAD